jgi:cation transport protein ChaC
MVTAGWRADPDIFAGGTVPRDPRRPLRLTEHHVSLVQPELISEEMPPAPDGLLRASIEDHLATWRTLTAQANAPDDIWVFAYGSLIWNPAFAFTDQRIGLVRGWHRAFCLGWNTRWRGSDENPGLMLALDRGGSARGMLYRLPAEAIEDNIVTLFEREMAFKPSAFPPRWVNVETGTGICRALTFCIDRNSGRYVSGLTPHEVAQVLARARGTRGSMAEYLYATVQHLDALGLYDSHLWELEQLVAEHIERDHA